MTVYRQHFTPDDRAESVYRYLPFEVPASAPGVRVRLDFEAAAGVLDLGLIDPHGWRGWSGGARREVSIGPDTATAGYLDRGLPAGTWQVVLGLHRLPRSGLTARVDVELTKVSIHPPVLARVVGRPPRRVLPAPDGLTWYAGDLHSHTRHSDGTLDVDELAALAAAAGLDFLAVTDHNTVSHHAALSASSVRHGVTLLPGQELTTADGHANAFGDLGWIDFRRPAQNWVEDVVARGGVFAINHPIRYDCAWRHPLAGPAPAVEVWHSSWHDRRDGGPLAWWATAGGIPVGGSDFHRPGAGVAPGVPTTWLAAESPEPAALLAALATGRTAVTADPTGAALVRLDVDLVAIDADAAMLVCPDGRRTPVRGERRALSGHPGPHLLETDDRTVLAISP